MSDETEILLSITQVWTVADCWNRYVEQTKNMDNLEGLIDDLEAARLNILAEHEAQFANPPSDDPRGPQCGYVYTDGSPCNAHQSIHGTLDRVLGKQWSERHDFR